MINMDALLNGTGQKHQGDTLACGIVRGKMSTITVIDVI